MEKKLLNSLPKTSVAVILVTVIGIALVSKEWIVCNEEILVLVAFVGFCAALYYNIRGAISEGLDSRAENIQKEFEQYFQTQEEILKTTLSHQESSANLVNEAKDLIAFAKAEMTSIREKRSASLKNIISQQIEQKLSVLNLNEVKVAQEVQEDAGRWFVEKMHAQFSNAKPAEKKASLKESLALVKQMAA
jgi:F0F1-type ATP synthase membrane subunit b/b'